VAATQCTDALYSNVERRQFATSSVVECVLMFFFDACYRATVLGGLNKNNTRRIGQISIAVLRQRVLAGGVAHSANSVFI
jgi:hypothetical protein